MATESAKTHREGGFWRARGDDRPLAELARSQHGVVGRQQLLEAGWTEREIDRRIQTGRLHRLHAGVYAVGHEIVPQEGEWLAAVFACGHDAVLSHWSAAALWSIRPSSRTRTNVTVPHPSRSNQLIQRHISAVPADERTEREGIPVTTVPRTILDLAAIGSLDVVESLLRESEFHRLYDRLSLRDLVERYPSRRGVRRVRTALGRLEEERGHNRSPLEARFSSFLRHHRLPTPRFNDWITVGAKHFQVDCHWPGTSQIVELDGWQAHGTRSAFREDRTRDRILRVAGYSVTRITWNELAEEPEAVAADLRALVSAAPFRRG